MCKKKVPLQENLADFLKQKGPLFHLERLGSTEQTIMRNASLLPLKGIQIEQFLVWSRNVTENQIMGLISLGLLEYDKEKKQIWMHPLIQEETRYILKPDWHSCQGYIIRFVMDLSDFWNFPLEKKAEGFQLYFKSSSKSEQL